MNQPHAAVLLLGLAGAACGGEGPKVALRYHPRAGAVYHYGLEQRLQLHAESGPLVSMGTQQSVMHIFFTQTVKGPASEGGTEIDVVFENLTMEAPGVSSDRAAAQLASMQCMCGTVVVDDRGKVLRSDFARPPGVSVDVTKQLTTSIQAMTFGFPDYSVGRGDSWTITTELPLPKVSGADVSAAGPARTTLTLRDIRIAGADTSVVLDITTQFPSGPINLSVAGQQATLKLDGKLVGHQQFSISQGAILDGTIKGIVTMNIAGPLFGSTGMRVATDIESSVFQLPIK